MNSDKQSGDQQQKQQHLNKNSKPELTAEWTVRAQLTISRPDGLTKQYETDDRQNPVRVVYKWSSDNLKSTGEDQSRSFTHTQTTGSPTKGHHDSFHSTAGGKPPSDSGHSSSNASRKQSTYGGARCKSTCSIVLSAVADFLPSTNETPDETDPFLFNTTTSYNISPDHICDDTTASQSFGQTKILTLRDAFSQTSDTETKRSPTTLYPSPKSSNNGRDGDGRKRMPYDYRRITESMLPPPVEEGDSYLPSYTKSSPQQHFSSQSTLQQHGVGGSMPQKSDAKKPPRTVHIDVYCTGSDAEDDEDDDDGDDDDHDDSSQTSSDNPNEIESNSTPQTVLDTEQMLLRHQRAGKSDLPRRIMTQQQQIGAHVSPEPTIPHLGHALAESNTADEISESKQILFNKHIGDQRSKINFRNRNFRRDQSDDALSSNYPNSSRSTMRDMTCSSISSVVASNSALYEDAETSWKETEPEMTTTTSLAKSDSFEYDNSIDKFRINKMDRLWSHPGDDPNETTYKLSNQQKRIQEFLQSSRSPRRSHHDTLQSEYDNLFETDHSYAYDRPTIPERDEPIEQSEPTVHTHRLTIDPVNSTAPYKFPERHGKVVFTPDYNKSGSETSTLLSNLSGYTSEYLSKARKFGAVVTALRKPGHHVGPSKNPECQCEHCRRWMAERNEGRGRAYSMGDAPFTRTNFWLRRANTPNIG